MFVLCVNKECLPQRKCGKPLSDTHTKTVLLLYCVYCVKTVGSVYGVQILIFACVGAEVMNFDKIFLGLMKPWSN